MGQACSFPTSLSSERDWTRRAGLGALRRRAVPGRFSPILSSRCRCDGEGARAPRSSTSSRWPTSRCCLRRSSMAVGTGHQSWPVAPHWLRGDDPRLLSGDDRACRATARQRGQSGASARHSDRRPRRGGVGALRRARLRRRAVPRGGDVARRRPPNRIDQGVRGARRRRLARRAERGDDGGASSPRAALVGRGRRLRRPTRARRARRRHARRHRRGALQSPLGAGVAPEAWHRLWLFSDLAERAGSPFSSDDLKGVAAVERFAASRDPSRQLSRLFHLLGRRALADGEASWARRSAGRPGARTGVLGGGANKSAEHQHAAREHSLARVENP